VTVTADNEGEWLTLTAATRLTGVSERTLRRWVAAGAVESRVEEAHGHPVRLILQESLPGRDGGQLVSADRDMLSGGRDGRHAEPFWGKRPGLSLDRDNGHSGVTDRGHVRDAGQAPAALQVRWEGAQLAARLHAARYNEERERRREVEMVAREREAQLAAEIAFMREMVSRSQEAERELRILLAQTTRALEAQTERPALSARNVTPRRSWWRWWARCGRRGEEPLPRLWQPIRPGP
jgi:hypothetical protein